MIMRNFTKMLCIVLVMLVAFSVTSCSLTKQYSYKTDDVELPIGVYIYYLQSAYSEAQSLAQKSDLYDSEAGTYDGSKSFLKLEITDDDGKTAIAEDWIMDKAAEYMNQAVAIYYEYNKLKATIDEAELAEYKSSYKDYWDNGYSYYGYQQPALSESYEPYGISFDSFFQAAVTINLMSDAVFKAEYAVDGPMPVTDEELHTYFEDNYTSYHYFSANLYTTTEEPTTDSDGNETTTNVNTAMTDAEVKAITASFDGYAADVKGGTAFSDVLKKYNEAYEASATSTDSIDKIDAETTDELKKAILELKEGEAKQITIGDNADTRQIYLIYKEPIADTTESYFSEDGKRDSIVSEMKSDDFKELLKSLAKTLTIDVSSACKDYKPSMFESKD